MDSDANILIEQQVARPRSKARWIPLVVLLPGLILLWLHPWDRSVKMSDAEALALTLDVKRADGLTYRTFVETRLRKARCEGNDPVPLTFSVMRTGGMFDFIRVVSDGGDSNGRCSRLYAVVAGIPLARAWDDADYPDYRGHLGEVFPADKGMDHNAEPSLLLDFRRGAQP